MKKMIVAVVGILMLSSMVAALSLDDLDVPDKMTVEEYLIANFDDITQLNVEDLDGEGYEIMVVGDKYVIILVEGEIFVILKD